MGRGNQDRFRNEWFKQKHDGNSRELCNTDREWRQDIKDQEQGLFKRKPDLEFDLWTEEQWKVARIKAAIFCKKHKKFSRYLNPRRPLTKRQIIHILASERILKQRIAKKIKEKGNQ